MYTWVLVLCLVRTGCVDIDMYSERECKDAKHLVGHTDVISWCIKRGGH